MGADTLVHLHILYWVVNMDVDLSTALHAAVVVREAGDN